MVRKFIPPTVAFLLALTGTVALAQEVLIDFETLTPGASVEGPGTVSPLLSISAPGNAVVLQTGVNPPSAYGSPNDSPAVTTRLNNCLEDANGVRVDAFQGEGVSANGFGVVDGTPNYEFLILQPASSFSIRMFDFGDYNPSMVTNHVVRMQAFGALNNLLDTDELVFDSLSTDLNPPQFQVSGDACRASFGQPGYFEFSVSAPEPIERVTLEFVEGWDPKIGFDSIRIFLTPGGPDDETGGEGDGGCTPGYWKNHVDSWSGLAPDDELMNVFLQSMSYSFDKNGGNLGDQTALAALGFKGGNDLGGSASILLRAAVAALLNAASPGFEFALTPGEVVTKVDTALLSGDRETILDVAKELDELNNTGCPIDGHYNPSGAPTQSSQSTSRGQKK